MPFAWKCWLLEFWLGSAAFRPTSSTPGKLVVHTFFSIRLNIVGNLIGKEIQTEYIQESSNPSTWSCDLLFLRSTFRIRRRGRPQLHFHFGRPLHAHIMAASFVTLFQWRLNSMLLQENEILLGVKDQIESLISKLDAVGSFTGDADRILGRESCHQSWASELRGMLCEAEDFVDGFIIKVYGQTEKDREDSIAEFRNELQNTNSRVSEILNRRPRLAASLMLEEIQRFLRSKFVFDEDKETARLLHVKLHKSTLWP